MTWKRKPAADSSWLSKPLELLTRAVVQVPWLVLFLALAAVGGSLWLTTHKLGFRTSRAELLNPSSEYNRRWIEYVKEFGDKEDVVVVVEGSTQQNTIATLDDVCDSVAKQPTLFTAVLHQIDGTKLRNKGLYYLDLVSTTPKELNLRYIAEMLKWADPILKGDWSQLSLGGLAGQMSAAMSGGPAAQQKMLEAMKTELPHMAQGLSAAFESGPYQSPWPEMSLPSSLAQQSATTRLISKDGLTGFILLRFLEEDTQGFAQNDKSIKALRQLCADVRARHPGSKIGLTGMPILEHDEMQSSEKSMSAATFLSFAGVLAVIIIAFGGFRHGTMAMTALVMAMIWACGAIALTVGYVNVLSIAFGSILFGLGIDYGIYYVARYLELRKETDSTSEALAATAASTGPGVLTGAITAALAFFAAGCTDFPGVAQLGIIAGSGVLLCWLAEATVLPAMICIFDRDGFMDNLPTPLDLRVWLRPMFAYPRIMLLLVVTCTVVSCVGIRHLLYDYNLLHMQPSGLESVELEHKLFSRLDRSAWYAISVASTPEEVLERKQKFLQLPSVERVEEIVSKLPSHCKEKRPIIEDIHRRLANLPKETPQIPVTSLADLKQALGGAQAMLGAMPELASIAGNLQKMSEMLNRIPPEQYERKVRVYQQAMATDLLARLRSLEAASSPEPPQIADLPASVTSRFIGKTGRYAMQVYSKTNIWEVKAMSQFVHEVRTVDPDATGNPMQVYEASWQMKHSFEHAAFYALLMIAPAILIDFRQLNHTLLAMLPMGIGLLQTLGLMGLLDIPLNPANMIVLPLTIGIGVESGINLLHELRCQHGHYRGPGNPVIVAVVVNSLTTMVGFGALMIANHQGLQSLGRVLVISMGCCLFTSLVLPNLLIIGRFNNVAESAATQLDDDEDDDDLPEYEA